MRKIVLLSSLVFIFLLLVACVPQKPLAGQAVAKNDCLDSEVKAGAVDVQGSVYTPGEVRDLSGIFTDVCIDAIRLTEYFCQGDVHSQKTVSCPIGCKKGACNKPPVCGNNVVEAGEQCDDGNTVDTDTCSNTCVTQKPDLVVDSASFSLVLNVSTGKKDVKYTTTVKNKGNAASAGPSLSRFFAYFRLAVPGVLLVDKQNVVPALQVGETTAVIGTYSPYSISDSVTACPGMHILNITVDYLNQVAELNETNNGRSLAVYC